MGAAVTPRYALITVKMSGANINRRTKENVEKTGLDIEQNERLFSTIVRSITLSTMV
ncbi:hypothetical protein D3C76_1819560 [compost metagenome]